MLFACPHEIELRVEQAALSVEAWVERQGKTLTEATGTGPVLVS